MLPPGLALIALSERAWAKAKDVPVRDYYFDLHKERKILFQAKAPTPSR